MTKYFFSVILIFLLHSFSYSQCEYNYSQLISLLFVNESNFETNVLKNGFEYDQKYKKYICSEDQKNLIMIFREIDTDGTLTLGYLTQSKEQYLLIKEGVVNAGFKYSTSDYSPNLTTHFYEAKGMLVIFATQQDDNNNTNYLTSIQVFK